VLEALPRYDTLLEAMSAYDLVGFQTDHDLRAFRDCVVHLSGGRLIEDDGIAAFGRVARAATFPIGIDPEEFASAAVGTASSLEAERLRASLVGRALIIGVDRLDYSKGLPNRFEAFGQLLARSADWRGRMTFMQIAPRSRSDVRQYRELRRHLEQVAGRINGRFAEPDWTPLRYLNKGFPRRTLASFYRIARVGLVTPLRDGMNLVAKEYVAAQDPADPGALVLSRFAGAARELTSALLVNPFDIDEIADTLQLALAMPRAERIERWEAMMEALRANSIANWRDRFIAALQHPAVLPEAVSPL
jgi:trehalose 6-phosphate synthase